MRDKPYTSNELFDTVCTNLKNNHLLPDCLDDYFADSWNTTELKSDNFDVYGQFYFGCKEGMYLYMLAKGRLTQSDKVETIILGAFKTTDKKHETCNAMGNLMSEFVWQTQELINKRKLEWS